MSKVRHCFLLCFYRVKSIPYGEFYHHKHEKIFKMWSFFPVCEISFHKLAVVLRLNSLIKEEAGFFIIINPIKIIL